MMNDNSKKRISLFLALFLLFMSLPEVAIEAHALTYKITIRWTLRARKKKVTNKNKTKIKLSKKSLNTTTGEKEFVYLKKAKAKKVKWYSSNKKRATVKKQGKYCVITAKKKGRVTITAKYKGRKYKCKVNIKKKHEKAIYVHDAALNKISQRTLRIVKLRSAHFDGYDDYGSPKVYYTYDWVYKDNTWGTYEDLFFFFSLRHNIYPIEVKYKIDDPTIIDADIDYENDNSWDSRFWFLELIPKKAGETQVAITNSYNKQKIIFKIIVTDDIVDEWLVD